MEKALQQVADAFRSHSYEIDLIPTKQVTPRIIKERLAHYARSLTAHDTFAMYSHSHGGSKGTRPQQDPGFARLIRIIALRPYHGLM